MGTIDSTIHALCSNSCQVNEERRVVERGSSWRSSGWEKAPEFSKFNTEWSVQENTEPRLLSATCKLCGEKAEFKTRYGG
jgi:hypothetical protein